MTTRRPPRGGWDTDGNEWSKAAIASGKAVYERISLGQKDDGWVKWDDLDIDTWDHFCIAGRNAVDAALRVLGIIGGVA